MTLELVALLGSVLIALLFLGFLAKKNPRASFFYRKTLHIWTGTVISIALLHTDISIGQLQIVAFVVSVFVLLAYAYKWLKIDEQLGKREPGVFYFALSFFMLCWIWGESNREIILMTYWLIVLADPVATIIGKDSPLRFQTGPVNKSIYGSIAFLLIAFPGILAIEIYWLENTLSLW